MKQTIILCDKCGATPAIPILVPVGRQPSGAGDSETMFASFDLCHGCAAEAVKALLDDIQKFTDRAARIDKLVGKAVNIV